jgi:hypothetical protein
MAEIQYIPYENNTLGAKAIVQIPATLEGLVSISNPVDVHNVAVRQIFYNSWNNKFRKALVEELVAVTGAAIPSSGKTKTNRKGETTDILITEADYIKHLLNNNLITEADYYVTHAKVAATIPFEVPAKETEAEPAQKFINLANQLLAMVEAGTLGSDGNPITEDSFVARWSAQNPGFNFENLGGFTTTGIARALEIDDKRRSLALPAGLV